MRGKLKLIIADDHAIIRDGIAAILAFQDDMTLVDQAEDGEEAVRKTAARKPDLVIMDLRMPGVNGAEATARIKRADPAVRVLVLTSYGDSADLARAMRNGADGTIEKTAPKEELLAAIRTVAAGNGFVSDEISRQLAEAEEIAELTERQIDILEGLARGLTNQEIAKKCHLSEAGVKFHLLTIFRKLGVSNRAEAVSLALRRNLLKM